MKIFYHTDMDGKCSAAIVCRYLRLKGEENKAEYIPINYNMNFPFEKIEKDEKIYIVDFSLQKLGEFDRLLDITSNVTWIDHHKTAIEKESGKRAEALSGIRLDGVAACELTWDYFFFNTETPMAVKLLGDYDLWKYAYGEITSDFQTGMHRYDSQPYNLIWVKLLDDDKSILNEIEREGHIINRYIQKRDESLIKAWSFWTEIEGYRVICCNVGSASSKLFDSIHENNYDIMSAIVFDGKQWTVSLYTKREDIDVSEIAKKYGGGGHKQAAGFQCKELPFKKVNNVE